MQTYACKIVIVLKSWYSHFMPIAAATAVATVTATAATTTATVAAIAAVGIHCIDGCIIGFYYNFWKKSFVRDYMMSI